MDRLTKQEVFGGAWYSPNGTTVATADMTDVAIQRVLNRLAAYEDTGLTPEELDDFARQVSKIRMAARCKTLEDCYKLMEEGGLIGLPCKVGDEVWVTSAFFNRIDPPARGIVRKIELNGEDSLVPVQIYLGMKWPDKDAFLAHTYGYGADSIGKVIFLTREEAEAALAAQKGDAT